MLLSYHKKLHYTTKSVIVYHLLPEGGLLTLAQAGIAGAEEVSDDLFLAFDAKIPDQLEPVLRLHDFHHPLEGLGVGPHQGVGRADGEVHLLD